MAEGTKTAADVLAEKLGGKFYSLHHQIWLLEFKIDSRAEDIAGAQALLAQLTKLGLSLFDEDADKAKADADKAVRVHFHGSRKGKNEIIADPQNEFDTTWNEAVAAAQKAGERVDDINTFMTVHLSPRLAALDAKIKSPEYIAASKPTSSSS